jgi:hypothetical protein
MPTRKSRVNRKKRNPRLSIQEKQLAQTNSALMAPTGVLLVVGASALFGNPKSKKKKIPKKESKTHQKNFNKLRSQAGRSVSENTYYETISELGKKTKRAISRTLSKVVEGQKLKQLYNPGDGVYGASVVRARFAKGKKKSIKKKSKRSKK